MLTMAAYAPQEILPLNQLVEVRMLVHQDGALQEHATCNAQRIKFGPLVLALIVQIPKFLIVEKLHVNVPLIQMLEKIVLALENSTPLKEQLSNKLVTLNVPVPPERTSPSL